MPTRTRGDELKAMASISEEGGLNDRSMRSTVKPPLGRPPRTGKLRSTDVDVSKLPINSQRFTLLVKSLVGPVSRAVSR